MKFIIVVVLALCSTVGVFASGEDQDRESFQLELKKRIFAEVQPEVQVFTGTFKMEEGEYPAIFTDDGKLYYLKIPSIFVGTDMLPAEGAALSIEAFKTPYSPVHLMVVSAEVDGEAVDMEWFDGGYWYGPKGRGHWGAYGPKGYGYGPKGRGHWGAYGPKGYGHWGAYGPKGYGYGPKGRGHWGAYGPWDVYEDDSEE